MKISSLAAGSLSLLVTGLAVPPALADTPAPPAASHQLQLLGETNGFGSAMSRTACDVNGDQLSDTVLGDPTWVRVPHGQVGAAYVLLGSPGVDAADLTDPASGNAVRIDGPQKTVPAGTWAGWSVSCLGDVNGDGLDDVVVGTGSRHHHDVAVIFGARDFGPVDLADIGDRGFVITDPGAQDTTTLDGATDNFGYVVGPAGDVDGDGLDDIAVADLLADYHGTNAGRVWIIRGAASTATVDVQVDTARVLHTIDGAVAGDRLAAVAPAGDVDGDGKDDLMVGAYTAAPWSNGTAVNGAAYVVRGGGERAVIAGSGAAGGFTVLGPSRGRDRLGIATAGLGDIDGDGHDDIAVGADGALDSGRSGGVAIVLGSASPNPVLVDPDAEDLTVFECADGTAAQDCDGAAKIARGHWIDGAQAESHAGFAVAALPDVDGDEVDDLLVGAYADGERGAAYVVHLEPGRTRALELGALTAAQGERFSPTIGSGAYGRSVGALGDVDGNGHQDFVFGGQRNNVGIVLRGDLPTDVVVDAPEQVLAGQPLAIEVAVPTRASSLADQVAGTVRVTRDGEAIPGLEAVPVTGGAARVVLPGQPRGDHALEVAFTPAEPARHRASETRVGLTVAAVPVESRLEVDSAAVTVGDEVHARLVVDAGLTGPVDFTVDGEVVASAAVSAGEAATVLTELAAGMHEVAAVYAGDDLHAPFAHTTTVEVAKAAAELGPVRLSTASALHGASVTASVTVEGGQGGEVSFVDNGALVGRVPVGADGVASVVLRTPHAGRHAVTATYHGNDRLGEATAVPASYAVRKARPIRVAVRGASFAKGTRPKVKVTVGRLDNGRAARGKVRVSAAGRTYVARVTADGTAVLRLRKASKPVKVRATFIPTDTRNVASATSASVTLRIRR